jgi:uncharacterized protein YciI
MPFSHCHIRQTRSWPFATVHATGTSDVSGIEQSKILACGAKLDDLAASESGGIYILDTEDRQEAERFVADDPFTNGRRLFDRVEISRWRRAHFNFVNCLPRPKGGTLIELES